ncbi:hypothetical protein D3C81_1689300 [compost metagenome]
MKSANDEQFNCSVHTDHDHSHSRDVIVFGALCRCEAEQNRHRIVPDGDYRAGVQNGQYGPGSADCQICGLCQDT